MSIATWIFTLLTHAFILIVLYKRSWRLLWLPLTLLCVLGEATVVADAFARHGRDSWPYFHTVLTFDILNVLLYSLCIFEAWKKHIHFLTFSIGIFLAIRIGVLCCGVYSLDLWQIGKHIQNFVNMICLILWAGAFLWMVPREE